MAQLPFRTSESEGEFDQEEDNDKGRPRYPPEGPCKAEASDEVDSCSSSSRAHDSIEDDSDPMFIDNNDNLEIDLEEG